MTDVERLAVPVEGGDLIVRRWGPRPARTAGGGGRDAAAPVVIAAHGITSSHVAWSAVAPLVAPSMTVLAPDLRGRGDSAALGGPYGIGQHARDLVAVLDHVGAERAVVAGHSMGGFVAAVLAAAHPERTSAVVLVDGGPALMGPLPDDVDVDAVLEAVIGPAMARLSQRFATREEYRDFWRDHPALRGTGVPDDRIVAYADHDAHAVDGGLRPRTSVDAVRADARDTLLDDAVRAAVGAITVPAVLLLAERGMLNDATPLYPDGAVGDLRTRRGPLEVVRVPDVNHYTICLSDRGAPAVARQLQRFADA